MKVLFFAGEKSVIGERLQKAMESVVNREQIEIMHNVGGLSERLCRPVHDLAAAVLVPGTLEEFSDILTIGDLLTSLRIILVLPERDEEASSNALDLYPRFTTYADQNSDEVVAVLEKILNRQVN